MKIDVKIVRETINGIRACTPVKGDTESAGYDISPCISGVIYPNETKLIDTGIRLAIPTGYHCKVEPRSSTFSQHQINISGIIDSGYTGTIMLMCHNFGKNKFEYSPEDRIAQIIFRENIDVHFIETEKLDRTIRGSGGFGSTGK